MSVEFNRTTAAFLMKEAIPLFADHHKEISDLKEMPLEPNFAWYEQADEMGALRCYSARLNEVLMGYAVFIVNNCHHQARVKSAECTVLFIDPKHRKNGYGRQLIAWCDEQLRLESVQVVYHHVEATNNFAPLLGELGYGVVEHIYSKRLD